MNKNKIKKVRTKWWTDVEYHFNFKCPCCGDNLSESDLDLDRQVNKPIEKNIKCPFCGESLLLIVDEHFWEKKE